MEPPITAGANTKQGLQQSAEFIGRDLVPLPGASGALPRVKPVSYPAIPEEAALRAADRRLDTLPAAFHNPQYHAAEAGPLANLRGAQVQATLVLARQMPKLQGQWLEDDHALAAAWRELNDYRKQNEGLLSPGQVKQYQRAATTLYAQVQKHDARGKQLGAYIQRAATALMGAVDQPLHTGINYPQEGPPHEDPGNSLFGLNPLGGTNEALQQVNRARALLMAKGEYPPPAPFPKGVPPAQYGRLIAEKNAVKNILTQLGNELTDAGVLQTWGAPKGEPPQVGALGQPDMAITPGMARTMAQHLTPWQKQILPTVRAQMRAEGKAREEAGVPGALARDLATFGVASLAGGPAGEAVGGLASRLLAPLEERLIGSGAGQVVGRFLLHQAPRLAAGAGGGAAAGGTAGGVSALLQGGTLPEIAQAAGQGTVQGAAVGGLFASVHSAPAMWRAAKMELGSGWDPVRSPYSVVETAETARRVYGLSPEETSVLERRLTRVAKAPAPMKQGLFATLQSDLEQARTPKIAAPSPAPPETPTATATVPHEPRVSTPNGTSLSLRHLPPEMIQAHGAAAGAAGDLSGASQADALLAAHGAHEAHANAVVPHELTSDYAKARVKPGQAGMTASRVMRGAATRFATEDPDLAQKLHQGADLAERGFRRNWLQEQGVAPAMPPSPPALVSPWRRLTPEQQAKLPVNVRSAMLVQDAAHSLEVLAPGHRPVHSAAELPGKPKTVVEMEKLADRWDAQAGEQTAARVEPKGTAPPELALEQPGAAASPEPVKGQGPAEMPVEATTAPVQATEGVPAPAVPEPAAAARAADVAPPADLNPHAEVARLAHTLTKQNFQRMYGNPADIWPNAGLAPVAASGKPGVRLEPTQGRAAGDPEQAFVLRGKDGQPVGTLAFKEIAGPAGEKRAAGIEVYVDPAAWGRGVASQLFDALEGAGYTLPPLGSVGRTMTHAGAGLYHGRAVAKAVAQGLVVPPEVLADYPKYQAVQAADVAELTARPQTEALGATPAELRTAAAARQQEMATHEPGLFTEEAARPQSGGGGAAKAAAGTAGAGGARGPAGAVEKPAVEVGAAAKRPAKPGVGVEPGPSARGEPANPLKEQQQRPRMSDDELAARRAVQDRQYQEALKKQKTAKQEEQARQLEKQADEHTHHAGLLEQVDSDAAGEEAGSLRKRARFLRDQARAMRRGMAEPTTAKEQFLKELEVARTGRAGEGWTPTELRNLARLEGATTGHPVDFTGFRQERVAGRIPETGVFHGLTADLAAAYQEPIRGGKGLRRPEPLARSIGRMSTFAVEPLRFENPLVIRGGHYKLVDQALKNLPFSAGEKQAIQAAADQIVRRGEPGYALLDKLIAGATRRAGFDSIIYRKPNQSEATEVVDLRGVSAPPLPHSDETFEERLERRIKEKEAKQQADRDRAARRMGYSSEAELKASEGPRQLKQQQQQRGIGDEELAQRQAAQREQEATARAKQERQAREAVYEDPTLEKFLNENWGQAPAPPLKQSFREKLAGKVERVRGLLSDEAPGIRDNPENRPGLEKLRRLQKLPNIATLEAHFRLNDALGDLTPAQFKQVSGAAIVRDLLEDVKHDVPLPPGITAEMLKTELPTVEAKLAADPAAKAAYEAFRKDNKDVGMAWRQSLIDIGQQPPELAREDWFHHEVRQESNRLAAGAGGATKLQANLKPTFSWEREGGAPFNTHLIEATQAVKARMIRLTEENKAIRFFQDPKNGYNIKPLLDARKALAGDEAASAWFRQMAESPGGEIQVRAAPPRISAMAQAGMLPDDPNGKFEGVIREIANNRGLNEARPAGTEPIPLDPGMTGALRDYAQQVLEWATAKPGRPTGELGAVPPTHRAYRFVEGNNLYRTTALSPSAARLAEEVAKGVTEQLTVGREDLRNVIAVGKRRGEMVLPVEWAQALERLRPERATAFDKLWRNVAGKVKAVAILNPEHLPTFVREKALADATRIFRGNPDVFREVGPAAQDLWALRTRKEAPSPLLRRWYFHEGARGLIGNMENIGGDPAINLLGHLAANPPSTMAQAGRVFRNLARLTPDRLDELVRYASFRSFAKTVAEHGEPQAIGAARRDLALSLKDPDEQAHFLANHLMGAYDEIPASVRWLRDRFPFPYFGLLTAQSRSETNLFLNAVWREPRVYSSALRAIGLEGAANHSQSTVRATNGLLFLTKMMTILGGAAAYNYLTHPKEEQQMDDPSPHLDLGHAPGGGLAVWPRLGALPNAGSLFGLDDPMGWGLMALNGHLTKDEIVKHLSRSGPAEFMSLMGVGKMPVELAMGRRVATGNRIDDRMEYAAQQFHVPIMYEAARRLIGAALPGSGVLPRPQRGGLAGQATAALFGAQITDPGDMAYRDAAGRAREWVQKEKGLSDAQRLEMQFTPLSGSLYYYKKALEYQDGDTALKYLAAYVNNGGTEQKLHQNLAKLEPLYGLNRLQMGRYLKTLGGEDRAQIRNAYQFWQNFVAPTAAAQAAGLAHEPDLERYAEGMRRAVDERLTHETAVRDFLRSHPKERLQQRQDARTARKAKEAWRSGMPAMR
jgi:GNAT superfamily N-acetyltransferase